MKILLLGPIHREKEFLQQKGNYPFLKSQGQQGWVNALISLGHDVIVFRYTDSYIIPQIVRVHISNFLYHYFPRWYARWRKYNEKFSYVSLENIIKNKKLLTLADKVKFDILFISGGIVSIDPETIATIKQKYSCPTFLFSGINPEKGASVFEKKMVKDGIIDTVVENDEGYAKLWKKMGAKKTITLPISSVDPLLHKKVTLNRKEKNKYACDVCFVGTLTQERQEILKQVRDDNFNIKIWGDIIPGFGLSTELKSIYQGTAFGEKMVKIFNAAKVVLNFQPADMTNGGNMRTFEITGCGAFQLADKVDQRWFENGKEVVLFKDIGDLRRKITYYLEHELERKKITENGYIRAHKEHTYEKHFKRLLQTI